jgi:hypothetical protein
MRVLIACEVSGVVRDAFIARGYDAVSCDIMPTESKGPHIQDDVLKHIDDGWDLMIAHPPCTHLAISGARHFKRKKKSGEQQAAVDFFMKIASSGIDRVCIENPVCIMSKEWRKPDQVIQPYYFGDPVRKTTWLWLKGLPRLHRTNVVRPDIVIHPNGKTHSKWDVDIFNMPKNERGHARSKTFQGIADAMALQWGVGKIHTYPTLMGRKI